MHISSLFNGQFLNEICKVKCELEKGTSNTALCQNHMLNNEITLEEVQKVVNKVKANKAVGVVERSNEILKTQNLMNILHV